MKININDLQSYHLKILREIGEQIGVKAPTSLKKEELILEIKKILNGENEPYFTNKGRPTYKNSERQFEFTDGEKSLQGNKVVPELLKNIALEKTLNKYKEKFYSITELYIKQVEELFDKLDKDLKRQG